MNGVAVLVWGLLTIALVAGYAVAVLRPVSVQARPMKRSQVQIADFICLFVLLQPSLLSLRWMAEHLELFLVLAALFFVTPLGIWWYAVRLLNGLGVRDGRQRAAFHLVVFPIAIGGGGVLVVWLGFAGTRLWDGELPLGSAFLSVGLALAGPALWVGRCVARWVVAGADV